VAAALTLPLYDVVFDVYVWLHTGLARTPAGYGLYHGASAAIALLVMLPTTFLAGMTLPLITHRLLASGAGERAIGEVYAANTFGAIAGVVLTTHLLIPSLGLKGALLAGAAVDVLLGVWLLRRPKGELAFSWPGFASVIVGLGALAAIAAAVQLDPRRMASGPYRSGTGRLSESVKLVSHADGKTATVSVIDAGDVRMLLTNGKTDASMAMRGHAPSADEPTQVLAGALAIGANPQAKRVAIIGVGSGITSATLLGSPTLQRLDTIEIERRMLDGAKHFTERNAAIWSDERSHFVIDDAKAFLARSELPYDIIVSEPSNPWVSGVASLFTEETYARFAKHLAPGGVLVQWLQLYDTEPALVS
jgi:predicted membrane-bound spermidine synthase